MRYWIKHKDTGELVGRTGTRVVARYALRLNGGMPFTAKQCVLAKKRRWAGDIVKAGKIPA